MQIIGIDVGGAYSTAFFLDGQRPQNLKEFVQTKEFIPFKVKHNAEDFQALLDLKPDWVIFEPTGFHYEALLMQWLDRHGQPWRKVVGSRMANYRKSLGLPKTDGRDALAIACYGWDFINDIHAFVPKCELQELRKLWIERDNCQQFRGSLINRLRQQLKHEFPEVADKDLDRKWGEPCPAVIRWMAEDPTLSQIFVSRYRNMHQAGRWKTPGNGKIKVTQGTIGSGIGNYSRLLSRQILEIDQMNQSHEAQMLEWMNEERFDRYREAFDCLGLSINVQTIWLTRIYPIEKFLGEDGRPIKTKRLSKNGKTVTHYVSLGRFKASLGAGLEPNTSGISGEVRTKYYKRRKPGSVEKIPMGDKLCRRAFTLWGAKRLEMLTLKPETLEMELLIRKHSQLKEKGTKRFQRLANLHGYAARLLFRLLT